MTISAEQYQQKIDRLQKINRALITRIEAGPVSGAAYDNFAHSVFLADKVRDRTEALNETLSQLSQTNRQLSLAQQQAQEANASRSKLMAAISHDIMQPVCAAQLLLSNLLDQSHNNGSELLAVNQAVGDIERLLQGLLDYARHNVIDQQPTLQTVDIHQLLHSLTTESAPLAAQKDLSFQCHTCYIGVQSDPNLLTRILRNLISNAIRYTDKGGISIQAQETKQQVVIKIQDTGIGFSEQQAKSLFQPFHKADNHTNTDGLGLGLANVEYLCHQLDHELSYTSQPGEGSCFQIKLTKAKLAASKQPIASGTLPFQHKIIIVDNNASVCRALQTLLNSWGAETSSYTKTKNLSAQQLRTADLILMDYHLDDSETGVQVLERYTDMPPVLFITASNEQVDVQNIRRAGYELINKPIRPARLRQAMANLITI